MKNEEFTAIAVVIDEAFDAMVVERRYQLPMCVLASFMFTTIVMVFILGAGTLTQILFLVTIALAIVFVPLWIRAKRRAKRAMQTLTEYARRPNA